MLVLTRKAGESIVIPHAGGGIFGLGSNAKMDLRTNTIAQLQVAGDEIGMEVGEKHMPDGQSLCFGVSDVLIDIALWINNNSSFRLLVANQVGRVGQTAEVVLLQ